MARKPVVPSEAVGARTRDLRIKSPLLYQLSYSLATCFRISIYAIKYDPFADWEMPCRHLPIRFNAAYCVNTRMRIS